MENLNEISKRILTIKKTFNVPRNIVWEAWTMPEHIVKWWSPPGMKMTVVEHEFKVGGKWKYTTPMPDGSEFISEGIYSEIISPEKIVTSANFRPMTEGVTIHVLFEENGAQNRIYIQRNPSDRRILQATRENGLLQWLGISV